MKSFIIVMMLMFIGGCSTSARVPYEKMGLDTTSNFNIPTKGKAGIYVFQWKTGVLGAGWDVDCGFKGGPEISLNTGEYGYLEVSPGQYEYRFTGGVFPMYFPLKIEADKNYFFRGFLLSATDHCILVMDQKEIDEAKENIKSGRYELNTVD
ncbi:hypothetical protein [Aeromonas media]|uniref:hypothetical protein n=1 Tax=Aeromonas TaxID=642 RepID=UPI0038D1C046